MKNEHTNPYTAHHEVMLLLPWYVNKTLHNLELKTVENHIKVCLTCRREIATLQKLQGAVNMIDALETTAQASFSRLKARIYQTDKLPLQVRKEKPGRSSQTKWDRKFGFDFLILSKPALAMFTVLMLLALIPGYFVSSKLNKQDYRTLSNPDNSSINSDIIRLIFIEGITEQQRESVLQSINGKIVEGPNSRGVYLIRLEQVFEANNILEIASALRKSPNVIFAEPSYALLSSPQAKESSK